MGDRAFEPCKFTSDKEPLLGDVLRTAYGTVIGAHSEELRCAVDQTFVGPEIRGFEQAAFESGDHRRAVLTALLVSEEDSLFEAALESLCDQHAQTASLVDALYATPLRDPVPRATLRSIARYG